MTHTHGKNHLGDLSSPVVGMNLGHWLGRARMTEDQLVALLPSLKAPTISNLHSEDWFAVETIVGSGVVRDLIPLLKEAGAEGIIEYPLNKVI